MALTYETRGSPTASVLAYLLTATFTLFVLAAFVLPIIEIKAFADGERVRVTDDARSRLERLIEAYGSKPSHDEHLSRKINMCYEMECVELSKLREYPYGLGIVVQLLMAVAVPVSVVWIEGLLR